MVKTGGHTPYWGYGWKLCPYSLEYKVLFYDEGYSGPSPAVSVGTTLSTADHTTTDGRMIMKYSHGGGWMCNDPLCPYYLNTGQFYYEV